VKCQYIKLNIQYERKTKALGLYQIQKKQIGSEEQYLINQQDQQFNLQGGFLCPEGKSNSRDAHVCLRLCGLFITDENVAHLMLITTSCG
tara:strand:- start:175 stop:444 length:270 start_codon:yes stop_codon:yes gene_type:complete